MIATRRRMLAVLAGFPALLAARGPALATAPATVDRLIRQSRDLSHVAQRIDFISAKLLGVRYQADTLIGTPTSPEKFVIRDDAFDCVTYCEVVLAAALSHDLNEFESELRRIRYDHGVVQYDRRNHYFADWCRRNIDNGLCKPVAIEPTVTFDKTVTWHREFGRHRVTISGVTKATLFAQAKVLAAGDIVGFTSGRASLDYYHTGLIALGKNGELLMRHASQSHGRVVEERMTSFVAVNPVHYVTVLRAAETTPVVERR